MASDLYAFVKFSDGTMFSGVASGATNATATNIQTGGTGLNQVEGIDIGQAYSGKVAIAASIICVKDATAIGAATADGYSYGYFLGPDGKIMCIVQGGGSISTGMPKLAKPVKMQTGIKLFGALSNTSDGAGALASLAVYCTDGTSDVFFVASVADTKTAMVNKDGSTIGQALDGKVLAKCYATYNSSKGLNEDGAGVSAFYLESAEGQLKMMFPPTSGNGMQVVPYMDGYGTRVTQNDTLSVTATT
jgi:hypothetical protein